MSQIDVTKKLHPIQVVIILLTYNEGCTVKYSPSTMEIPLHPDLTYLTPKLSQQWLVDYMKCRFFSFVSRIGNVQ